MGGCGRLCYAWRGQCTGHKCKGGASAPVMDARQGQRTVMGARIRPVHRSCVQRQGQCPGWGCTGGASARVRCARQGQRTGYGCVGGASAQVMDARRGQHRGQHRRDAPKGKGCVGCIISTSCVCGAAGEGGRTIKKGVQYCCCSCRCVLKQSARHSQEARGINCWVRSCRTGVAAHVSKG